MLFNLILSIFVGGFSALMGWILQIISKLEEVQAAGVNFGQWHVLFYVLGAVFVLAGVIDFFVTLFRLHLARCRAGGKSSIRKLPKQGHKR